MPQVVAFAVYAFQAAAAVATTVGTAMGFSGLAATVAGATALVSSTTQAWSVVSSALSPKPNVSASNLQLQTKVGAVAPRAIIMGRTAVAGTLLTPTPLQSGRGNALATNIYALSHVGPSGVVESVLWGDDTVTFDAQGQAIGKYANNMWLFQKNGSWSQTSITFTGTPGIGADTPTQWDSTKRAQGCLVVALVVRYAASVLANNMQNPKFVVDANAVVLTDPRTGSAATTQAQRRNPAVWAYSWRLGWSQNSNRLVGMNQPSSEIHTAGYAYAANVADTNGWTIAGEANTADDAYAVESRMLQACAAIAVERNGLQSVVVSALRSSVGTITSDMLRSNPRWRYQVELSGRPNAIQPRYRSESNRWQIIEGTEITDSGYVTVDRGVKKSVPIEYPYVGGGAAQVGHLAALDLANSREPLVFTLPCKQSARYIGFVGDAVTVSIPEIGLSSTKMVVIDRFVQPDGTVDYELLVETDSKYSFAAGKTSTAPSFTLQPGFDIFSVPQPGVSDWASVAAQITSGATSLPIVRVTGSAADYSFCTGVVFKIRLNSGGSPWLVSEDAPPAATQHEFRGLTNATGYIVGVAYRGVTGVEGPVRELAAVTTGAMVSASTGAVAPGAVRVGTDIFPGSGMTALPGTQLLNSEIGIDGNGRLTNTGTGSAIVGNAQITIDGDGRLTTTGTGSAIVDNGRITIDAFGRLTTTGTGSVVVDNSKITLGTLGFTGATDATRNVVSTGLLANRPVGSDGDFYYATDDNNGAGLLYNKVNGAWVSDPKAKVLFDSLSATVNGNEATNSAFRSAQASDNAAQAARLTTLDVSYRFPMPTAINKNPNFSSWTGTLPDDWVDWANGSANTKATGDIGVFAYRQSNPAGLLNYGIQQIMSGKMALGWHVLEAEVTLNSGTLTGAAVHLNWGVSTVTNSDDIRFLTDPDITGAVVGAGTVGRRYRFSKLINITVVPNISVLYAMTTWEGAASSGNAKDLTWHKCLVRQASQAEIDAKVAKDTTIPNLTSRISTEESARASADSALATRATNLEATVNNGTTGVAATAARLTTEETTRASADAANASQITTLEARSFVKGNLVKGARPYYDSTSPNSLFSRFGYVSQGLWNVNYSVYVDGPYFSQSLTSVSGYTWNAMVTNAMPIQPGIAVSAQAMLGKFGTWTAGTLRLVVYWYTDAAGTTGASQAGNKAWEAGVVIAGQNGNGRWVDLPNLVAPSGTQSFRIGIWTDNVTGNGVYTEGAAWMLKAEYGSTCTAWSDEALPVEIDARVRTEESTRASADSALATRATALETTVNDGTTGLVATRARLITEESTRATADAANASSIQTLTARVNANPNLFPAPTPVNGQTPTQQGWVGTPIGNLYAGNVGGLVYFKARAGGAAVTEYYIYDIPNQVLGSGDNWTVSACGYGGAGIPGDRLGMYIEAWDPTISTRYAVSDIVFLNDRTLRVGTYTNYGAGFLNNVTLRVVFYREWAASGSYQDVIFNMVKVEVGQVMTAFTNTAQIINLNQVSVEGRSRAYAISGIQTEVNGRKGGFVMDNNGEVTSFQITADDFRIYQSVGGSNIVPFRVVGGQTQINDALIRTLSVIPDGGGPSHRVQLRPNSVTGADGASFTFSPAYGGIPLIRPVILQPPALGAGETYDISATALSASGFTIRAKKFTAGTPTSQSSGAGSNVGGTPAWQAAKPTSADGDGNSYTYNWTATIPRISNEFMGGGQYYAEYFGEFDIYYNAGGGWVYAYTAYLGYEGFYSGSSPTQLTGQVGNSTAVLPAIGQHGGNEFGLHAISGTITAFAGVSYTTTTQSSVVSLPGNFTFDIYPPT